VNHIRRGLPTRQTRVLQPPNPETLKNSTSDRALVDFFSVFSMAGRVLQTASSRNVKAVLKRDARCSVEAYLRSKRCSGSGG
jgi:hypothetical protein